MSEPGDSSLQFAKQLFYHQDERIRIDIRPTPADLKSSVPQGASRFDPGLRHQMHVEK